MEFIAVAAAMVLSLALPECPDTPNCVSSQAKDPGQLVEPFSYQGRNTEAAKRALKKALGQLPRTEVVSQHDDHLKAIAKSYLFGFVDDLDFIFDDQSKLVHVRSASRVGYWDLGVNARRVKELRKAFQQALQGM